MSFFPSCVADGCLKEPVLLYPHTLQSLHTLQALVPSLLRHEVETALEKLDLTCDRTYAWDVFLDMMVRPEHLLIYKEAYVFVFHWQITKSMQMTKSGEGDVDFM